MTASIKRRVTPTAVHVIGLTLSGVALYAAITLDWAWLQYLAVCVGAIVAYDWFRASALCSKLKKPTTVKGKAIQGEPIENASQPRPSDAKGARIPVVRVGEGAWMYELAPEAA